MFKPHYGICNEPSCGKERLIVVKKGLCDICNRLSKGKAILKKFKPKKATGERQFFLSIWNEREHISEVSGLPLLPESHHQWHWQFSHYLSKKSFPAFRLNPENCFLCLPEEHQEYEFKSRGNPKWDKIKEKYEILKQQYYAKKK